MMIPKRIDASEGNAMSAQRRYGAPASIRDTNTTIPIVQS